MAISRVGILREDVRKSNKLFYSLKDKQTNFYTIPDMKYLISSGIGTRNIYAIYDFKEIWTIGRFINRVKHYTVKELDKNFSRMPLEVDWGDESESGTEFTVMMWVPNYISDKIFNLTMHDLNERLGEIDFKIDLAIVPQRNCAQLLHEGSYQEIGVTKQKLLDKVERQKYKPKGMLQEIFMNHPCCNPPEKLKILIRQEIEL